MRSEVSDPGGSANRAFRLLWVGETSSKVGTAVTGVALPLLATVTLRSSPFQIGLIAAVQWIPWLLFGLPAGAWVDRLDPRRVMLGCDAVCALSLVSVPLAAAARVLTVAQVMAAAFVLGLAGVFFSTAYLVYLPQLVPQDRLVAANARLQGSESSAQIAGPSLGGVLTQIFGAASGLVADTVSFAVSAVCLLLIRRPAAGVPPPDPAAGDAPASIRQEIREGLRYVSGHRVLRLLTVVAALANLTMTAYESMVVVFLVRSVHLSPPAVGLLMATTGIGGVLGAFAATPTTARLGEARAIRFSLAATAPFGLLVPLTTHGAGTAFFVLGGTVPVAGAIVYNVVVSSFRQKHVPRRMLGRISASMRFLMFGMIPVGAVAGGGLGSLLGLRTALWCVMAAALLPAVLLLFSPLRRMRDLGAAPEPGPATPDPDVRAGTGD